MSIQLKQISDACLPIYDCKQHPGLFLLFTWISACRSTKRGVIIDIYIYYCTFVHPVQFRHLSDLKRNREDTFDPGQSQKAFNDPYMLRHILSLVVYRCTATVLLLAVVDYIRTSRTSCSLCVYIYCDAAGAAVTIRQAAYN